MSYHFSKTIDRTFDRTIEDLTAEVERLRRALNVAIESLAEKGAK